MANIILLGGYHFHHVLKRIAHHHNQQRPHQGFGNVIPVDFRYPNNPVPVEDVRCAAALGGLLNHYYADKAA